MKGNESIIINTQQIQIFLKCVSYGNFSRVAAEEGFTVSMISKTVAALEEATGLRLFERSSNKIQATEAAKELALSWAGITPLITDGIKRATAVQERRTFSLKIGFLQSSKFTEEYIMMKLDDAAYGALWDSLEWEWQDMNVLAKKLAEGSLDAALLTTAEIPDLRKFNCSWKKVYRSPIAVFIPRECPAFNEDITSLSQLAPYPFITLSQQEHPVYYEIIMESCREAGFTPKISVSCDNTESVWLNYYLGKGIVIAPSLICSDKESQDFKKCELKELKEAELIVAWRKDRLSPALEKFVDIISH